MKGFIMLNNEVANMIINKELSSLSIRIYLLFLKRNSITKFIDEDNEKYFIYTRETLAKELNIKMLHKISESISELKEKKIIKIIKKEKANAYKICT